MRSKTEAKTACLRLKPTLLEKVFDIKKDLRQNLWFWALEITGLVTRFS